VAIYTNEDCFPIAFDSEEELLKWFITLLQIHLADKISEGEELKPIYGKEILFISLSLTICAHTALRHISDPIKSTNNLLDHKGSGGPILGKEESCVGFYN
jgi:hypothetical protein